MCLLYMVSNEHINFYTEMLRHRHLDGGKKSDGPTYVAIVKYWYCNYLFLHVSQWMLHET